MSRFFSGGGASDAESSSGSDSEREDNNATEQNVPVQRDNMMMFESSSSDEEKRVVRSLKDKRFEALGSSVRTINNLIKAKDFVKIKSEFDILVKVVEKSKKVIEADGYPRFLLKLLVQLEDYTNECFNQKSELGLNKIALNALVRVRQSIKKYNKDIEKHIDAYKATAGQENFEDEAPGADEEDQEEEEEEDDFDEDDEEEEEVVLGANAFTRDFWVKKEVLAARQAAKGSDEEESDKDEEDLDEDEEDEEAEEGAAPKVRVSKKKKYAEGDEVPSRYKKPEVTYTPELIESKLKSILSKRGKRGMDRQEVISELQTLIEKSLNEVISLKCKNALLSSYFDMSLNKTGFMSFDIWKKSAQLLMDLVLAVEKKVIVLSEDILEEDEKKDSKFDDNLVYANLGSFLVRLSEELIKSFGETDIHSQDYLDKLSCEIPLLKLASKIQDYYGEIGAANRVALIALLRAEILYCKYQSSFDALHETSDAPKEKTVGLFFLEDSVFHNLCKLIFAHDDSRLKSRAMILLVYNYALHNHFHKARDVFLMSHVQDNINQADISTQILYNRALAQFGLCAFRCGHYKEALQCMTDLHANPVKEILAQGVTTKFDAEEEFLKFERSNQIPDHLHIAPDLLDAVHVLSAMIMEIPYIAANDRRHVINRNFRRLWENYNKQPFNGPPDTTRDCAMAASKALSNGFWKKAVDYVNRMKFWGLIAKDPSIVKTRLESAIKEVALKSYLIRYGRQYTAISLDRLVVMFSMPSDRVHRIVSHMMIKEELDGAWDQTTKCIIMNASEPNALQQSSLQFSDKICLLSEQHEKILEQRGGVLIAAKDQKGKQGKLPKKGIRPVRPVGAKKSTEAVALKAR